MPHAWIATIGLTFLLPACSPGRGGEDAGFDRDEAAELQPEDSQPPDALPDGDDGTDTIAPDLLDGEDPLPDADDVPDADGGEEAEPAWPRPPGVGLMHTSAQLLTMWENRSTDPWLAAYDQLMEEARAALSHTPSPMRDFDVPGYYVDPDAHTAAKQCLTDDGRAAYALALAYQLAEDDLERTQFADRALLILDAWAFENVSVSGADGDLVMMYRGIHLLYAADLVFRYGGWNDTGRAGFLGWVRGVFLVSAGAKKNDRNNHGDWGTLGAVAGAAMLGDAAGTAAEIERIRTRIAENIDANGELPQENLRTNSGMWYTYFALAPMTAGAQVGRNVLGVNLFEFVSPEGRSIRLALDRLFFYCLDPGAWPYELPEGIAGEIWRALYPCADEVEIPQPYDWPGNLYEIMSSVYSVSEWEAWVAPYRPQRGQHAWIYVTLMRGAY
jgi:hypothetical protein